MTRQEGIEPPTHSLEGCCSIQLSYWRFIHKWRLEVGAPGFEPGTSCSQSRRDTRLRYAPRAFECIRAPRRNQLVERIQLPRITRQRDPRSTRETLGRDDSHAPSPRRSLLRTSDPTRATQNTDRS